MRDNRQMSATQTHAPDAVCAAAVDLARAAALAVAGAHLGDHLTVEDDGDRVATHLFECKDPAYRGWRWGVQVSRASRAKVVTVNDVVLLPGPDALQAPAWLPWSERLRPGDLRPGDLLPAPADDDRLQLVIEDTETDDGFLEMGVGRVRVLSEIGRTDAAERWYTGDNGPEAPVARQAPAHCVSCGFFVPVTGALGLAFGVCANEFAPDDGRVVSVDHGCGAHSEGVPTVVDLPARPVVPHDDYNYEHVDVSAIGSVEDAAATPGHVAPISGDDAELAAGEIVEEIEVVEGDEPVYGEAAVDGAAVEGDVAIDALDGSAGGDAPGGAAAVPARESGSSVDEAVADDSEETAAFGHS